MIMDYGPILSFLSMKPQVDGQPDEMKSSLMLFSEEYERIT
jgi:hypothetical protein